MLKSSFTGKTFAADSYLAALLLPILGMIFAKPWWLGLLIIPTLMLIMLPFVLLVRAERAALATGRPAWPWAMSQIMLGIVMLIALFPITMYVHLPEAEFRYMFGWYPGRLQ